MLPTTVGLVNDLSERILKAVFDFTKAKIMKTSADGIYCHHGLLSVKTKAKDNFAGSLWWCLFICYQLMPKVKPSECVIIRVFSQKA